MARTGGNRRAVRRGARGAGADYCYVYVELFHFRILNLRRYRHCITPSPQPSPKKGARELDAQTQFPDAPRLRLLAHDEELGSRDMQFLRTNLPCSNSTALFFNSAFQPTGE